MLPVHPAVKRLEVVKRSNEMGGSTECIGESYFEDGVRMGSLYDLAQGEAQWPITRVGVSWVRGEAQSELSGLARNLGLGKEKDKVLVNINWTMQCCSGGSDHLGPEFESLGYEGVNIKWGQQKDITFR